jgi:hypothetical protein
LWAVSTRASKLVGSTGRLHLLELTARHVRLAITNPPKLGEPRRHQPEDGAPGKTVLLDGVVDGYEVIRAVDMCT